MAVTDIHPPRSSAGPKRPLREPPGPVGSPLVGVLPALRRDPIQLFLDAWRAYGDVVRLPLAGGRHGYLLAHPDHVRHVLQENHANYRKDPRSNEKLKETLGEGLLTAEGEHWLSQRRLMQPAFHRQRVAAFGTLMTERTLAMLDRWEQHARTGAPLEVASEMMQLTFEIIGRAMFGADLRDLAPTVARALAVGLEHTMRRIQAYPDLPPWLPLPDNLRFRRALRDLDRVVYRVIEGRRAATDAPDDLLSLLLHARDEGSGARMDDRQLRDEVMTILLAGHETTAVALTWSWYLLSRHPEVRRRLQAELSAVLGDRPPTVEDLAHLPYTHMVVQEAMRLYPPAWVISRVPLADDAVDGFRLPAGEVVFLSPYVTHRHPAFWENPEGFDPERFAPERSAGRPRFAYFPFGGGPRLCIGNSFALQEAQLILATIARQYQLDLVPGHPVALHPLITLRPRYGMPMTVRRWR